MYLTVPVPNPSTRVIKVNFCSPHGSPIFIKIATTIDRESNISNLIEKLKDEIKNEQIQPDDDLTLYEVRCTFFVNFFLTFSVKFFFTFSSDFYVFFLCTIFYLLTF